MPGVLLIGFRSAGGGYTVVSAANPLPVTGGGGGGGGDVNLTGLNGIAPAVGTGNSSTGTQRVVLATDQPVSTAVVTAAAYSGADASLAAMVRAIANAALDTAPALTQNVPLSVRRTITPGTNVAAGKALAVNCTTAGVLTIELSSGDTMAFNLATGPAFFDDIAAIDIAWSSGGAGTAYVLDVP